MIRQAIAFILDLIADCFAVAAQMLRESVKTKVHDIDSAWVVQGMRGKK